MTSQEHLKTYEKALATQQWENIEPLLHPDICVTFNNGTYKGLDEVEGAFRRTFNLIKDETYSISNIHWIRDDDALAVCLYHFHWSGIINGQMASGGGRGTSVLVNENGRVVLTHDRDFGTLAIAQQRPFTGIIYLRPGHIQAEYTLATLTAIEQQAIEVESPFIIVAVRQKDTVNIRVRQK